MPTSIKIYYQIKGYPPLQQDCKGNFVIFFDTSYVIYTSTTFENVKETRGVYCFKDINNKCFYEDYEIANAGFEINVSDNFISDTTNQKQYRNPYTYILIENKRP